MRKKLREAKEYLGKEYTFAIIDFGDVVYRDLGQYDIEIFYRNQVLRDGYFVVVWEKSKTKSVDGTFVEHRDPCKTLPELKEYVDEMVRRYAHADERVPD